MAPDPRTDADLIARAVSASGSGITVADATERGFPLVYVNEAFERLTGYAEGECLGRNCSFLQGPGTDPVAVTELSDALAGGHEVRAVLLNNRKDGTPFYNELRLSPVSDPDGRVVQVIGVQNDVSALMVARRSLELDRDRALGELRILQDALTPTAVTSRPHLELAGVLIPAELGVAGDFLLAAAGPEDTTVFVVGDAMGHGVEAARRATHVRVAIANFARFTDDPARLLTLANQALIERAGTSAAFVTAVCASFHPATGVLRWASAGHPVPLGLDDGAPIGPLEHVGAALGIALDLGGSTGETRLEPGDGVLLYTDGLPEGRNSELRPARRFGDERVRQILGDGRGRTPQDVVTALHGAAEAHSNGHFSDDLCLLAARMR